MKRRGIILLLCLVLLLSCAVTAGAESAATSVISYSTVTSNGDCQVSVTVTLRLEEAMNTIQFPVPQNAANIKKDGSLVPTSSGGGVTLVDLSGTLGGLVGTFTVRLDYTIPGAVKNVEGNLILDLPLLCGFSYPVETMDFTITLPGQVDTRPNFTSVYLQDAAESNMEFAVHGNMISGKIKNMLEDHDTLSMTLDVPEEMFPSISTYHRSGNPEIIPMCICAALALIYWIIFLRTLPVLPVIHKTAPEGITAGELGCRLTLSGADLTMMVFSWAQLGYLLIQLDDRGRVILHKRMEMGNERSLFEIRIFNNLFGKRQAVDGTGMGYARLCRKVKSMVPGERSMCSASTGNTRVFRGLCCGIQIFCGICLAMNLTDLAVLQILLSVVLVIFAAFSAWKIQESMYHIHLRHKLPLILGLVFTLVWILLGLIAGQVVIPLVCSLAQLLAGFASAYGGRRSDLGRQNISQILGLRKYLKTLSKEELQQLRRSDPEAFFNLAPYAMALGVGKKFAWFFGGKSIGNCPYLVCNIRGKLNAQDWMLILRETAGALDALNRRMDLEKYAIIKIR